MREVKILKWCDKHQPEMVEATVTRAVKLDDRDRMTLDLCEGCDKDLFADLGQVLVDFGVPLRPETMAADTRPAIDDKPRTANGKPKHLCPICQTPSSPLPGHIWMVHIRQPRPASSTTCPDCGITQATAQGIAQHRVVTHGYSPVTEAVAVYEDMQKTKPRKAVKGSA